METDQHNLILEEEEELVAENDALERRQSRRSSNNGISSTVAISSNGNGNGNDAYSTSSSSHSSANGAADCDLSPKHKIEETVFSHSSVYLDQDHGTESIDGLPEMKNGSVTGSTFETNSSDADFHVKNLETRNFLIKEINDQHRKNLDDMGFSDSSFTSLTALVESHEKQNLNSEFCSNETRLAGDFDLIEEVDQEDTELDVEKVLKKQNTHDLYCPNCNSCITRRVIILRRKPKIRNTRQKPKHNKDDTAFLSELDACNANSAKNQVPETVNSNSSGNPAPACDYSSNRETEVFRCLSCFSLFVPTGDGFKLFQLFRNHTENENMQNLQKTPATNKNWFFSIFSNDKKQMTIEQGNEPLVDQNELVCCNASPPKGLRNDLGSASLEARREFVYSSTENSKYLEFPSNSVGEQSEIATEKANKGIATSNYAIANTVRQLECSSPTMLHQQKGHTALPLTGILVNNTESADDASQGVQIRATASVSSTCKSFMPELSQVDKSSSTVMAKNYIQNNQASSIILGTPLPAKFFGEELINDPAAVCHETRKDVMFSSSQGTSTETVKTSVGETEIDAVEKKNTVNNVILNVESRSVESAYPQRAQNIDGSTEAASLLQSGTQTYFEQRGAGISVDILKCIIYGGLVESITSLAVVSSAAGAGSATLNVLALGLANLIGGVFIIGHNLIELKKDTFGGPSNQIDEQEDRYQLTLGQRENFPLHATVSIFSFLIFGMLPPVIYGFSFRKSDSKDLKLAVVGIASLACIILLAIGKAYVRRQPKSYISTVLYFVSLGVMASGASYIVGDLISKLVEKVGWFASSLAVAVTVPEGKLFELGRTSY